MVRLNPCFSGICIQRQNDIFCFLDDSRVLILVLVEYAFRAYNDEKQIIVKLVLILVLVEYAFRVLDRVEALDVKLS